MVPSRRPSAADDVVLLPRARPQHARQVRGVLSQQPALIVGEFVGNPAASCHGISLKASQVSKFQGFKVLQSFRVSRLQIQLLILGFKVSAGVALRHSMRIGFELRVRVRRIIERGSIFAVALRHLAAKLCNLEIRRLANLRNCLAPQKREVSSTSQTLKL